VITVEGLEELLKCFQIPIVHYGSGKAKKVEDLLNEIIVGDCKLIISKADIYREVLVIRAWINYKGLILKEYKQVFSDGSIRERDYFHISEKIQIGEKFEDALKRAVAQELKITSQLNYETRGALDTEVVDSPSYPGLQSKYIFSDWVVFLTDEQYREEGYVEEEKNTGLKTYFEWVSVDSSISKELKCKLFNLVDI